MLNRNVRVKADGSWVLPNIPANFGLVRARATCVVNGDTISGESAPFLIAANTSVDVPPIVLGPTTPIPQSVTPTGPSTPLGQIGATAQLTVTALYAGASTRNVTAAGTGTRYVISNPAIANITADGLVTALASGTVLIQATNEGTSGFTSVRVVLSADSDGDGLPDDLELALGLNPNNPADAFEDIDRDGASNRDEGLAGTNLRDADSDDDEILDGEELTPGVDGYVTNPLSADTDGDGVRDALEIASGSNPTSATSLNLAQALQALIVAPATFTITVNSVIGVGSLQLAVTGQLKDGTTINLTSTQRGTNYASSDLNVCNFGSPDGRVFGSSNGACAITVTNSGFTAIANGTVTNFTPTALGSVAIPGYANNVDANGGFAYVAAGATGLQVVNVANPSAPVIVASLDTPGNANDVRVVGNRVYIADGSAGLRIISVSNPIAPLELGSIDTSGEAERRDGVRQLRVRRRRRLWCADHRHHESGSAAARAHRRHAWDGPGRGRRGNDGRRGRRQPVDRTTRDRCDESGDRGNCEQSDACRLTHRHRFVERCRGARGVHRRHASGGRSRADGAGAGGRPPGQRDQRVRATRCSDCGAVRALCRAALRQCRRADRGHQQSEPALLPRRARFRTGLRGHWHCDQRAYVYWTGQSFVVSAENGTTGTTRLFIGQYIALEDRNGVPPTISITQPISGTSVIEGSDVVVRADATDDVAVASVTFSVNGVATYTDTSEPFEARLTAPAVGAPMVLGATAVDFGGNSAAAPTVEVTVIADPLTAVSGVVVQNVAGVPQPVSGATVTVFDTFVSTTAANGSFTIPNVPTARGSITAFASVTVGGVVLRGASPARSPVVGGVTDVGTIVVQRGRLYASSSNGRNVGTNPSSIFVVDTTTGVATLVGSPPNTPNGISDVSFDPLTGTLYAVHGSATDGAQLLTLNPDTAQVLTRVQLTSPFASVAGSDGLAHDNSGVLYAGAWSSGRLLRLNPATGAAITDTGTQGGAHISDLAVDPTTNEMWMSRGGNAPGQIAPDQSRDGDLHLDPVTARSAEGYSDRVRHQRRDVRLARRRAPGDRQQDNRRGHFHRDQLWWSPDLWPWVPAVVGAALSVRGDR